MKNIINVLKKEKTETLRDKKSLAMMLVIPIFIPIILIGISALFNSEINKDVKEYNKIGFSYELTDIEKDILKKSKIDYQSGSIKKIKNLFNKKKINVYVTKKDNMYTIYSDGSQDSLYSKELASSYLETYKTYLQASYLESKSISSSDVLNIITVSEKEISESTFYRDFIINYAFMFIVMAITVSATYPSTDSTAGEKERGTLETLLTFPINSRDIIIGKFLSVSISSIITGVLSLLFALGALKISESTFEIFKNTSLTLSFSSIIVSILTIILYSFLISGLCISIASKCKTFKEAQSSLTPLTFISFFPGMIAFMMKIKSSAVLSLIPFINFSTIFSEVSSGKINYLNILLMILSTLIIIFVVLNIIIKQYKSEKVLFSK
ncbi:MAG: ABC transporter permease [Bacilli bacterium]|nr:ABC transporter permease [Bacilli bacterium]